MLLSVKTRDGGWGEVRCGGLLFYVWLLCWEGWLVGGGSLVTITTVGGVSSGCGLREEGVNRGP